MNRVPRLRDERPAPRVGYVMTHYPKLAQTFIAGEIDAVERAGLNVDCFAMNLPKTHERGVPGAADRIASNGRFHLARI